MRKLAVVVLVKLFAERNKLVHVSLPGWRYRRGVPDDAISVDEDRGSIHDSATLKIRTIRPCDLALWMKVCEQRKRYSTQALTPIGMAIDTVYGDAKGLCVALC